MGPRAKPTRPWKGGVDWRDERRQGFTASLYSVPLLVFWFSGIPDSFNRGLGCDSNRGNGSSFGSCFPGFRISWYQYPFGLDSIHFIGFTRDQQQSFLLFSSLLRRLVHLRQHPQQHLIALSLLAWRTAANLPQAEQIGQMCGGKTDDKMGVQTSFSEDAHLS